MRPAVGARLGAWKRFRRHGPAVAAAVVLVVLGLMALAFPLAEAALGLQAETIDLLARLSGPSWGHPIGTDELGRDLLLRLLQGARVSLFVGLAAALVATVIGAALGLAAGYFGGWLDAVLMRITDFVIALPLLPLLIVMAAADLSRLGLDADRPEHATLRIILILALVGWTTVARLARGAALVVREREYVQAARALGTGSTTILIRHVLPNALSPIVVAATLSVGNLILTESVLSFLGLGIQPPLASWGGMLTGAQGMIREAPQLAVWPGLLIFVTVVAFNVLGDGIRDAFDVEADVPGLRSR
ncbi:MAG: ABC transporter permease [Rhodospirillales bacterium]|nr:ABC transporter permease [Rhodospirillales bacterium]